MEGTGKAGARLGKCEYGPLVSYICVCVCVYVCICTVKSRYKKPPTYETSRYKISNMVPVPLELVRENISRSRYKKPLDGPRVFFISRLHCMYM